MKTQIRIDLALLLVAMVAAGASSCASEGEPLSVPPAHTPADTSLIDASYLDTLVTAIEGGVYGTVHSVLIHRESTLVFERYFNGYNRDRRHAVYSVTKSVTSALIGIAVERGEIAGVDELILPFFSHYPVIDNLDSLKESITLEHLLTMAAGFEWDEWTLPYSHPANDVVRMYNSTDWVKHVLDRRMTDAPGTRVVYNSGASMLLSAILTRVAGVPAGEYAATHLFGRMGVASWSWDAAPRNPGMSIGGWGLHLRPIDMVAFGRLYLQEGLWGSEQVVPRSWVEASTTPYGSISEWSEYGYQWWTYKDRVVDEGLIDVNDAFVAVGRGGQYIWVVPHYDLVVVSTAWNDNNGKSSSGMFFRYIIPAVAAVEGEGAPRPTPAPPIHFGRDGTPGHP